MNEEFQSHLEMLADRFVSQGMTKDEALIAAKRQFGGVTQIKEELRERHGVLFLDSLQRDVRYALRRMRKSPVFTTVAVLTLALCIGANTALFSIVNAVLLRSLPVARPDQLVLLEFQANGDKRPFLSYDGSGHRNAGTIAGTSFPYATFEQFRDRHDALLDVFAFAAIEQLDVVANGTAEVASGQYVSGGYYAGLGVQPWRGRVLTDADNKPGAPPAAVITWRYWQRRFGGDPHIVGTSVMIDNFPFTIVGVTPPGFVGAGQIEDAADLSIPLVTEAVLETPRPRLQEPAGWWLIIMGRLKPGVTREQARASLEPEFQQSITESLSLAGVRWKSKRTAFTRQDYPRFEVNYGGQGEMDDRERYWQPLMTLLVVVGLVLLIACINVANLLLSRGAARQKEFAMRAALGARRSRLINQLLTESLLLSLIAGALGCVLAYWGKDLLAAWSPWANAASAANDHLRLDKALDLRVLGFAAGVSLLTGVLFGLAPALRSSRRIVGPALNSGQTASADRSQSFAGRSLVVGQVAISLVLLMAGGIFIRTLRNLHNVNAGFNPEDLLLFRVKPQANGYDAAQTERLYDRLLERLGKVPGVRSVALSRHPLLGQSQRSDNISIPGRSKEGDSVQINVVSCSFFETMQIPILLGRSLTNRDTGSSPKAVVVNEAFVRKYFSDISPIGQHFSFGGKTGNKGALAATIDQWEIVGVSRDAKYTDLRSEVHPTVYQSYLQETTLQSNFELRYTLPEASIAQAVRQAVREIDTALPIFDLRTQTEQAEESVAQERMFANISGTMSSLALLLAAIGLYGTMSYAVVRRTQEIGIRMALGAQRGVVLAMVLRETLSLLAVGLIIGILLTVVVARASRALLDPLLFGVKPNDPITVTVAACVLLLAALVAGFVPAFRASRLDPMVALRCD
jgi:predicted permease